MDTSPDTCIADANIFIDFAEAGILAKLAEAGFALATTDLIADELTEPESRELIAIGVKIISLDPTRIARMVALTGIYRAPSLADLSALVLAEHLGIMLLTGDGELRKAAKQLGVSVHGTIWICDRLVESGSLAKRNVDLALKEMREKGRRLPGKTT